MAKRILWNIEVKCDREMLRKKRAKSVPSTDGEKMMRWSYRNWPYLIRESEGSSAVLNVRSKPRSEELMRENINIKAILQSHDLIKEPTQSLNYTTKPTTFHSQIQYLKNSC